MQKVGNDFVAGTHKGTILSKNNGASWEWVRTDVSTTDLWVMDGRILAKYTSQEVELSDDMGKSWEVIPGGAKYENGMFDIVKTSGFLVSSQPRGIYLSKDDGKLWNSIFLTRLPMPFQVMYDWKGNAPKPGTYPTQPMVDLIVVDGVLYGGTMRGC